MIDPGPVFKGFRAAEPGLEYNTCNGPVLLHPPKRRTKVTVEANYDVYQSEFGGKVASKKGADLSRLRGREEIMPSNNVSPGDYDILSKTSMFNLKGTDKLSAVMLTPSDRFQSLYTTGNSADFFSADDIDSRKKKMKWQKPSPSMLAPVKNERLKVSGQMKTVMTD